MAYKLNGEYLQVDVPFTVGTGKDAINYPANWLRLTSDEEKKAIGITEVDDPKTYDKRFYESDGTEKSLDDVSNAILCLCKKNSYGIFNIGNGRKILLSDIARKLSKRQNKKIIISKNKISTSLIANNSKLKKLGWIPKSKINDILKELT